MHENAKLQSSKGRSDVAIRCSTRWWWPPLFRPRACMLPASRPRPPRMGLPMVESACGTLDYFVVVVGRDRPCSDPFCARACRGIFGAYAGTLQSWGEPCLEFPRADRPRSLGSPYLSTHCRLWVEVTHTQGLLEARPRSRRPWRTGYILWPCLASSLSSIGLASSLAASLYRLLTVLKYQI